MFQRVGAAAYKANLDNTIKIANLLGNPHKKLKCVHVAGTNGKGSSSHMIASVLQKAGYKVGLYTSPHLLDFRERIKINGQMIPQNKVVEFVETYKSSFEEIEPSFFEWTVGLAFHYFEKEEVDIAVIEVGLGGRLDSTNIITPLVSLITNISNDHASLLGNTLIKIAGEKAGIIKPKIPVVISQQQAEIYVVFNEFAQKLKSPITYADKRFKVTHSKFDENLLACEVLDKKENKTIEYKLDLTGAYQLKNLLGVLQTIEELKLQGFIIEEKEVKEGLCSVVKNTKLLGRWQILNDKPLVIADTGHNEDGIKSVLENVKRYGAEKIRIVFGMVNDKESESILKLLPKEAEYYFVKSSVPRSLDNNVLLEEAKKFSLKGNSFATVEEGLKSAIKSSKKNEFILVSGSTFVVADALKLKHL